MIKGKILAYVLVIVGLVIVQKSFVPIMFGGQHLPDVVLMFVLALAIIEGFDRFLPWAVLAGLIYDLAGGGPIGLHVLIFVLVVYTVSFFSRRLLMDMRSTGVLLILISIISATVMEHMFVAVWFGWGSPNSQGIIAALGTGGNIIVESSYNALTFVLLFVPARKLMKRNTILISRI